MHAQRPALSRQPPWLAAVVCLLLAAMVWLVFGQTLRHGFVNYDDNEYIYENARVARGVNWENVAWAFTNIHASNWHPLTTLTHMLDCQVFGLSPAGHHAINVVLHAATAILLFIVLRSMTGALWRSAFVATVFAVHPLRVESVAWVSERKDVLSGFFFMLTLWAYAHYVQKAENGKQDGSGSRPTGHPAICILTSAFSLPSYWLVVLLFAFGLMSKPMLVTVPVVLLLLDYWPLRRSGTSASRLPPGVFLEKVPLLVLAGASCVVTSIVQQKAMVDMERVPLSLRVSNAIVAAAAYLGQMFWPANLAAFYPLAKVEPWALVLSAVVLVALTIAVFRLRTSRPYLGTGWWWYLVMLLPVIGIVQVGSQARADRYTYLPQIGLVMALTWLSAELFAPRHRVLMAGLAIAATIALALTACHQASHWKDSEALWSHALSCTRDNWIAHNNLGGELLKRGRLDEAIAHYHAALLPKPDYAEAHNNLGNALQQQGRLDEAIAQYQTALRKNPDYAEAWSNLGDAVQQKGQLDEAIALYQSALRLKPDLVEAHNNLGNAFQLRGRLDEAIAQYQAALLLRPAFVEPHNNMGNALQQQGRFDDAIAQYHAALRKKPDYAEAYSNLGAALNQMGRFNEAIAQYQAALQFKPYAEAHNNLGAALERTGRFDEAIAQYRIALQQKPDMLLALNNLASVLATRTPGSPRDRAEAVKLAERANQLSGGNQPAILRTLAQAYARAGHFAEAVETARRALSLADDILAETLRREIALYESGSAYRDGESQQGAPRD